MIILKLNKSIRILSNNINKTSSLNLRRNDSKNSSRISFHLKNNSSKDKENDKPIRINRNSDASNLQLSFFKNSHQVTATSNKSVNFESFSNESLSNLLKSLKENSQVNFFETLEEEILTRRKRARNSIYFKFESNSKKNLVHLLNDLRLIGAHTNQINYIENSCLIEFVSNECVNKIIKERTKQMGNILPIRNRTIFYVSKSKEEHLSTNDQKFLLNYNIKESFLNVKDSKVDFSTLGSDKKINEQIKDIYDRNKLDEFNCRMRYFIASLIEDPLRSIFPECVCLPFGSSINRLGTKFADLDLSFSFNRREYEFLKNEHQNFDFGKSENLNGDFFFINKIDQFANVVDTLTLQSLFDLIENFISNLIAKFETRDVIKNARVPIIKFDFLEKPRINCDLSMKDGQIAFNMTKLFWIYVQLDDRVLMLTFFVRTWASLLMIQSKKRPSPNFTNFQITMLVFNFLLRHENPLVIPIEDVIDIHGTNRFVKNLSIKEFRKLSKNTNNLDVGELFEAFLKYYAQFNFEAKVISLSKIQKSCRSYIVIENPFNPDHNTAKNVNSSQIIRFKSLCESTLRLIKETKNKNEIDLTKLIDRLQKINSSFVKKKFSF